MKKGGKEKESKERGEEEQKPEKTEIVEEEQEMFIEKKNRDEGKKGERE